MKLNELYLQHIGRVAVDFTISGIRLDPEAITKTIGVAPDKSAMVGDQKVDYKGRGMHSTHTDGFWTLTSKGKIESKDVNAHFQYLFQYLLPCQGKISEVVSSIGCETYFGVLWESTYLYAGTGPIIDRAIIRDTAIFDATIGFDIYQIDEK